MIKVFIVDDSEIHLEGMKSILKQADTIQITAAARQPEEARQILQKESFDLAIVDISLAEEADGLDLAQFIKAHYPHLPVLILSHYKNISYIIRALRLQLNGYLAKDTPAVELIGAIQAVAQGKGFYFGNTIPLQRNHTGFRQRSQPPQAEALRTEQPGNGGRTAPRQRLYQQGNRLPAEHRPQYRRDLQRPHKEQTRLQVGA